MASDLYKKDWLLGILIFAAFASSAVAFYQRPDKYLKIYQFNVGQGDAIFIETPNKKQILIDGGPDNKVIEKIDALLPFYDKTIDLVILSHPHQDHITGLIEVLKRYKIKTILESGIKCHIPECIVWEDYKNKEGAEIIYGRLGQLIILDKNTKFYVLHPFDDLKEKEISNPNNVSILGRLVFKNNSILLTGDAEKIVEEKLTSQNIILAADILKIAHHGSKTSTTEKFLKNVFPQMALISVGENNYGHPHQEVLDRLENFKIKYYRTDIQGDIKLLSDGERWYLK